MESQRELMEITEEENMDVWPEEDKKRKAEEEDVVAVKKMKVTEEEMIEEPRFMTGNANCETKIIDEKKYILCPGFGINKDKPGAILVWMYKGCVVPFSRSYCGSGGLDLYSAEDIILEGRSMVKIRTGFGMKLPAETVGMICDRSSVVISTNCVVAGGVIDSDYLGEIKVMMYNMRDSKERFFKGERIAQMLILKRYRENNVILLDELLTTRFGRGGKGFGSSNVKPCQK